MFYLFLHQIVVYRHFHIFNMASKMAANGHVTIIMVQMKVKTQLFQNIVMLHIKLKGITNAAACKHILC